MMQMVSMGLRPGVADLVVWWPAVGGVEVGYVEVKTETGKQSDRQRRFQERCEEAGVPYMVVRSIDDVKLELAVRRRR
jgi:hypothetical protein